MDAQEVVAARNTLGLTRDALAATLGLTPSVIAAWEEGTLDVPKSFADRLRYDAAFADFKAAVDGKGLKECAWDKAWQNEPLPRGLQAQNERIENRTAHQKTCPVCSANGRYIAEKFGKMPEMPVPPWERALGAVTERIINLPRWAQPGAWMALLCGGYSVIRIAAMLPRLAKSPQYWYVPVAGLALSVGLGGAFGLIYGGFREWRGKRGRA